MWIGVHYILVMCVVHALSGLLLMVQRTHIHIQGNRRVGRAIFEWLQTQHVLAQGAMRARGVKVRFKRSVLRYISIILFLVDGVGVFHRLCGRRARMNNPAWEHCDAQVQSIARPFRNHRLPRHRLALQFRSRPTRPVYHETIATLASFFFFFFLILKI